MVAKLDFSIKELQKGSERHFNFLFKNYFRRMHFFAMQYVKDNVAAENLVQETFITLWNKRSEIKAETEASLLSWIYTVLKNSCFQYLKKKDNELAFVTALQKEQAQIDMIGLSEMDTSEDTFEKIYQLVQSTLEELPPQCRKVFEMSRFDGTRNKDIAAQLNISEKAVEANITRALKVFRNSLKDYLPFFTLFWAVEGF